MRGLIDLRWYDELVLDRQRVARDRVLDGVLRRGNVRAVLGSHRLVLRAHVPREQREDLVPRVGAEGARRGEGHAAPVILEELTVEVTSLLPASVSGGL